MGASGYRPRLANPIPPTSHAPGTAQRFGARPSLTRAPGAGTRLPPVFHPFLATPPQPWVGETPGGKHGPPRDRRDDHGVRAARRPFRAPESVTDSSRRPAVSAPGQAGMPPAVPPGRTFLRFDSRNWGGPGKLGPNQFQRCTGCVPGLAAYTRRDTHGRAIGRPIVRSALRGRCPCAAPELPGWASQTPASRTGTLRPRNHGKPVMPRGRVRSTREDSPTHFERGLAPLAASRRADVISRAAPPRVTGAVGVRGASGSERMHPGSIAFAPGF